MADQTKKRPTFLLVHLPEGEEPETRQFTMLPSLAEELLSILHYDEDDRDMRRMALDEMGSLVDEACATGSGRIEFPGGTLVLFIHNRQPDGLPAQAKPAS